MASNRLEKIGTIYTRISGLMKTGAVNIVDRPLWYDVYEAFPPKLEPSYDRKVKEIPFRKIFYPEDLIRAQFYKKYGSPGTIQLSDQNLRLSLCQLFIEEYERLKAEGNTVDEDLFNEAALALEAKGIYLDKSRAPIKSEEEEEASAAVPTQETASALRERVRLADIFKESQD
ncbi:Structural constituent of ribosome [Halocaridina rubra]|uniref:Small ribosomal subunit protein mS23 n=1 Tax=Halocaridina rubra TaxID=373956 RepID=A0AAN9ADS3_HALRR